jgi:chromosomal replication initiation ATPase DnaA
MSQYPLPLPSAPLFTRDNFILSDCNRAAFLQVTGAWTSTALLLWGQSGCGKTHLGQLWASEHDAALCSAESLPTPDRIHGNLLVENIELARDQTLLFHLINHCREQGFLLLFTAGLAPKDLPFTLPDLTSRLRALPVAHIGAPDDALLAACLRKQFADRQLKVEEEVIAYITPRIERSFAAVAAIADSADSASLRERKNITIPLVKGLLAG